MTKIYPLLVAAFLPVAVHGRQVANFTMENAGDKITESVSGAKFDISSLRPAENVPGAKGKALRFDGYTTYVDATVGNIIPAGSKQMTASVWCAVETYPIVELDVNTSEQVAIASCLDESAKTGFGFFLGFDGKYSFKTYVGGWPLELKVDTPLQCYEWVNLAAVIDVDARTATLYNNGTQVASSKANGALTVANSTLRIGRSFKERFMGPFCLTSFNGLIDDITVWDEALAPEAIAAMQPDNDAVLAVPTERFADDPMRPTFHGMPGANWTNETHGLTFYNGRYHVFFQKNANGPYMARLHWGHLSSENLCDWTEEPVAIAPGEAYDLKGCWSGCVFTDAELTQNKPSIIYTGVDYAKAVIAQASPLDDDLLAWQKAAQPIINGRPGGLSDDYRDPYFFRNGNDAYIIVGSSKGGVGTTTLHAYNPTTRTWSNDGKTFFTGNNIATCGTFWEMPNLTRMGDKWLFTTTPQNTAKGVALLYWVGKVNADGTFAPDKTTPETVELPGFARDGYGLLSPSICQVDGKTIALGIVPDKLPSQDNYELGYAHAYSLPREWTLDADGKLCQKPYAGLAALRGEDAYSKTNFILEGAQTLNGIEGRAVELCGEFTVTVGKCGFTLLDDGSAALKVYYDGTSNEVVVDARSIDRLVNDAGTFDGYYHSTLPRQLAKGETVKLNVFFDHSVLDIFVNDTWASSVRIFAKGKTQEHTTVFADGTNMVKALNAWNLTAHTGAGIGTIEAEPSTPVISTDGNGQLNYANVETPATINVYTLAGCSVISSPVATAYGTIATGLQGFHIVSVTTPHRTYIQKVVL